MRRGLFFLDSEVLPVRIGRKKSPVKPYGTASRADLFAGSKTVFDAVVAELSGQRTAALTHAQLEELVAARGRELLRQLLQDHLDLRAAREEQAVTLLHQAGRGEVAGSCPARRGNHRRPSHHGRVERRPSRRRQRLHPLPDQQGRVHEQVLADLGEP